METPADIDLSEKENPLQPYLLEAEEAANETMEESEPPLDDSFEDDIIAVLGPPSKRQKRDHTNENDSMDEINPALIEHPEPVTTTNTLEPTTPLPAVAHKTADIPAGESHLNTLLDPKQTNNVFDQGDHVQITQEPEEDFDLPPKSRPFYPNVSVSPNGA